MKTTLLLLALFFAARAATGQAGDCPLPLPYGIQLNPGIANGRFIATGYFDAATFADTRRKAGRFLSRDERAQLAAGWDNAVWLNNERIAAWRAQEDTLPPWLRERLPQKYREYRSGAFAILDAAGRELTPPRYDEIVFFAALDAAAPIPVRVGKHWGYLNAQGEEIIAPQFAQPGLFYDGIARVKRNDGAYGYIDRNGQPAAAPSAVRPYRPVVPQPIRLDKPGEYSEGLASFQRDGLWGYRNEKGEEIIAPQFDSAGAFHDGLARVSTGSRTRYIRRDGTLISVPNDLGSMGVPDGALDRVPYLQNKQWGLLDLQGNVITPPRYYLRRDFEGILSPLFRRGVAAVYLKKYPSREQEVLIDRDGCVLAQRSSFFDPAFELLTHAP